MRAPLTLLLLLSTQSLFAQTETSALRLSRMEIRCGASSQLLAHIGVRQSIGDGIIGEVAFGGVPKLSSTKTGFFAHTLGVGFVPEATRLRGKGTFYSLLYSFLSEDVLSSERDYHHVVTGNVGYLLQDAEGRSVSARGGVGFMQTNARTAYGGYYFYTGQFHPWLNLEIAIGLVL